MQLIVDNRVVNLLVQDAAKVSKYPGISDLDCPITFRWPSLLEYLGWGDVYSQFPVFDESQPLFQASVTTLYANDDKEVIFYVYDRLFTEVLSYIRALPQMSAAALLQAIKWQRLKTTPRESENLLSSTLLSYETALIENPSHTMHDLILYLAWDRMCVWMGALFNYQSTDVNFIQALSLLKACLIESYEHITREGRTNPGIYRMLESFVFHQLREENIQTHTEEGWRILSQSFPALKGQNELADFFYIDDAVTFGSDLKRDPEGSVFYATLDSADKVSARLVLAQYMMKLLKHEMGDWNFILQAQNIIYMD